MNKKVAIIVSSRHMWISAAFSGVREAGMSPIICQSVIDVATEYEMFTGIKCSPELILVDGVFPPKETREIRKMCSGNSTSLRVIPPIIIRPGAAEKIRSAVIKESRSEVQAVGGQ
ncbi:hypothetical protein J7M28_11855 [bacterium]|nr:hypothetical protein [bacterium]